MKPNECVHRVAIVTERFIPNDKLESIVNSMHVWIVDSRTNREYAEAYWQNSGACLDDPYSKGITTFEVKDEMFGEETIDFIIDTIQDHHSEFAHTPGWSEAHVFGCRLTPSLKELFIEFGFSRFETMDATSFIAKK